MFKLVLFLSDLYFFCPDLYFFDNKYIEDKAVLSKKNDDKIIDSDGELNA